MAIPIKASAMKLLCLDTALASCSVCVYDADTKIALAAEQQSMERGQAEALPPMVARVMEKSGIAFGDLGRIAVTTGPGTFTGIRIGLSFARALGLARNIKVVGIDTMKAVQVAVPASYNDVNVIHQAGASGFFYFWNNNTSINIELLTPEQIVVRLASASQVLVGTGAALIKQLSGRGDFQLLPQFDLPLSESFAPYAASLPDSDHMPEPVYLREADVKPQKQALRPLVNLFISTVLLADDLKILAQLHASCFDKGWSENEFSELLKSPGFKALLATAEEGPTGFILYRAAADEAEIITIGVDPALRRRKVGQALLGHALAQLKSLDIKSVFLEVATSNSEAIELYRKFGFQDAGLRKAYYARANGTTEDAIILRLNLA